MGDRARGAARLLGRIDPRLRWGAIAALIAGALLVWFLFLRPGPQGGGAAAPPPRPALGQTLPYASYLAAIDDALGAVREAAPLSGGDRDKKIKAAISSLEKVEGARVETPAGGAVAEVDNGNALLELRKPAPDLPAAESALAALRSTLDADARAGSTVTGGTMSGQQAVAELGKVLQDPLFNYERDLSPLQRLARWLSEISGRADPRDVMWRWITAFVAAVAGGCIAYLSSERLGSRWRRLGFAAVIGLLSGAVFYFATADFGSTFQILGAVGLVVAVVAMLLMFGGVYRSSSPGKARQISELAAALGMGSGEARKRAATAAGEADYRLAIRFRCLAVLLTLDEAGKLIFDRASTNREYLFRAQGALHDELQPLLDRFDLIWYGEAPASEADWRDYDARASAIEEEVGVEARAAARQGRSAA